MIIPSKCVSFSFNLKFLKLAAMDVWFFQLKISFQVFDREGEDGKFVSVTVKATDSGQPSLEGVCSFTVEITDVNDNPPLFDRQVTSLTTL